MDTQQEAEKNMNTTFATFNKEDEASNEWFAIPLYELSCWCRRHYRVHYALWLKEREERRMMILTMSKKELLAYLKIQGKSTTGMSKDKKAEIQYKVLFDDDDTHWELCKAKERIIKPVNLELVRLKYDIDEEIFEEQPDEIVS